MARMPTTPQPHLAKKAAASTYVSTCKICAASIYDHEPHVWSRKPLGLCHTSCVDGPS